MNNEQLAKKEATAKLSYGDVPKSVTLPTLYVAKGEEECYIEEDQREEHPQSRREDLGLDATDLPSFKDRIRFFQQGGSVAEPEPVNNPSLVEENEEDTAIDYSSPPPVSVRARLFNEGHSSLMKQQQQMLVNDNHNTNDSSAPLSSVANRARFFEKMKPKKSESKENASSDTVTDIAQETPELLSLADRVKKFNNKKTRSPKLTLEPSTSSKSLSSAHLSSPYAFAESKSYPSRKVSRPMTPSPRMTICTSPFLPLVSPLTPSSKKKSCSGLKFPYNRASPYHFDDDDAHGEEFMSMASSSVSE